MLEVSHVKGGSIFMVYGNLARLHWYLAKRVPNIGMTYKLNIINMIREYIAEKQLYRYEKK